MIFNDDIRRVYGQLSADEVALMLAADPFWRLPIYCDNRHARMVQGRARLASQCTGDTWGRKGIGHGRRANQHDCEPAAA